MEHLYKGIEFSDKVLFTDESNFCLYGSGGCGCVWRKVGKE